MQRVRNKLCRLSIILNISISIEKLVELLVKLALVIFAITKISVKRLLDVCAFAKFFVM